MPYEKLTFLSMSDQSIHHNLQTVRKNFRRRRSALSQAVQQSHALAIRDTLASTANVQLVRNVGGYLANDGEVDLSQTFEYFWSIGVRVAVPKLSRTEMFFVEYSPSSKLVPRQFGIQEPTDSVKVKIEELDVVFVPVVAFRSDGYRLGRGGGYYDRTFARTSRPLLVGIAHSFQNCDDFSVNEWDIPMDAVVTERGIRWTNEEAKYLN